MLSAENLIHVGAEIATSPPMNPILKFLNINFEREREKEAEWKAGGRAEKETQNLKQTPGLSCQHKAWHGSQTHELRDHDLTWNQQWDAYLTESPRRPFYSF